MSSPASPVREYLASALTGSLVAQRARKSGFDITAIEDLSDLQIRSCATEFYSLGIDPEQTAQHTICALVLLFSQPDNREQMLRCLASVLWTILGDPKSGDPPEIYRKAAIGVWYSFLITLDPAIQEANGQS